MVGGAERGSWWPCCAQKCGTPSLAAYLRQHPALSGLSGRPGNEIFSKESHFFGGILGRGTTSSAALYRSFFPTLLTRCAAPHTASHAGMGRTLCLDGLLLLSLHISVINRTRMAG